LARLKEIKNRIHGIKSTQKITRAMKMVAAAKLRRAQDRIISARPYARKLNRLLTDLAANAESSINELLVPREISIKLIVVVSSDRGLAGSFNSNLIRQAFNYIKEQTTQVKVLVVGKKSYDFFKNKNVDLVNFYTGIFSGLSIETSNDIVEYIVKGYLNKEFDSVDMIYNQFKSVVKQEVAIEQFLPLVKSEPKKKKSKSAKAKTKADNYIYEPSPEEIINELIPKQLRIHFWKVLLESNAAEQAARMTAMETATQNASELLSFLNLTYNRARQAAITKELLEIVGGAEALKESI
jgi:F-type H+-transporting ATPase subunit gamma